MTQQLRAGPFGSSSNSFLDEPVSASRLVVPINGAMSGNANWVWKHYLGKNITEGNDEVTTRSYEDGLPNESAFAEESGGNSSASLDLRWRYQAVSDFTISVNYDLEASATLGSGDGGVFITVTVDGVEEFSASDEQQGVTSVSLSGIEDISIPNTDDSPPKLIEVDVSGYFAEIGTTNTEVDLSIAIT